MNNTWNRSLIKSEPDYLRNCNTVYNSPKSNEVKQKLSSSGLIATIKPKRTYANIHLFAQVLHKQIRARTISQNFEKSNYQLNQNVHCRKGFKGNKIKFHSIPKARDSYFITMLKTQDSYRNSRNESKTEKNEAQKIDNNLQNKSREKYMRPNANMNLKNFRRKYHQRLLTRQTSPQCEKDSSLLQMFVSNNNQRPPKSSYQYKRD